MSALIEAYEGAYFDSEFIESEEAALCEINEADSYMALENYYRESQILLKATIEGHLVMEDAEVGSKIKNAPRTEKNVKGIFNRISNFLGKIIQFIKDALNKFVTGISESMQHNEEWYRENSKYLEIIKKEFKNDCSVDVIPYWLTDAHVRMQNPKLPIASNGNIQQIMKEIGAQQNGTESPLDKNQLYQRYFPELAKLSMDPREASMLYYQGQNGADKNRNGDMPSSVHYENADAIRAITYMQEFMGNYKTYISAAQQATQENTRQLEAVQKIITSHGGVVEGYQFGPGMYSDVGECNLYMLTNLVDENGIPAHKAFLDFTDVTEGILSGVGQSKTQQQTAQGQTGTNTNTNTTGTVDPNTDPAQQKAAENKKQADLGNQVNQIFKICATVATARMTCTKQMCDHYCDTMKTLVDKVKEVKGVQQSDADNAKYNKEQEAREDQQQKDDEKAVRNAQKLKRAKMGKVRATWDYLFGKGK